MACPRRSAKLSKRLLSGYRSPFLSKCISNGPGQTTMTSRQELSRRPKRASRSNSYATAALLGLRMASCQLNRLREKRHVPTSLALVLNEPQCAMSSPSLFGAALTLAVATCAAACAKQQPECRLKTDFARSADLDTMGRSIRQAGLDFAAGEASTSHSSDAPTPRYQADLTLQQRARYYCEAILIKERADSLDMRRDLAARVAPGDARLLVWLGLPAGP